MFKNEAATTDVSFLNLSSLSTGTLNNRLCSVKSHRRAPPLLRRSPSVLTAIVIINKKVAFGDWTLSGRLSCYSVISSLQIFDDISYIIKQGVQKLWLNQTTYRTDAVHKLRSVSLILSELVPDFWDTLDFLLKLPSPHTGSYNPSSERTPSHRQYLQEPGQFLGSW